MMQSKMIGAAVAVATIASALAATPAVAQYRDSYDSRSGYDSRYDRDRNGYDDRYDRDRNGYDDRYDRDRNGYDDRYDRNRNGYDDRYEGRNQRHQWRYYGGNYGYNGYNGRWRTGQRYPYYNQGGYILNDYGRYGLPAPRSGYRYYRDNNGDVVMAAIASGVIGLIISGALNGNDRYDRNGRGYRRGY
jgi:Ni/Co efflux regulator RcnB